jgi:hypothetical protein
MGALVSLLVTIGLSLLVTRIASVALTMTGVSRDLGQVPGPVCLYRRWLYHQRGRKGSGPSRASPPSAGQYDITIHDPFDARQGQELEFYI